SIAACAKADNSSARSYDCHPFSHGVHSPYQDLSSIIQHSLFTHSLPNLQPVNCHPLKYAFPQ
ncbi:hypothetical protein RLK71_00105, partial [Streptococcus pneumoniae]|nr:hypothetical protein [Streptococcus pneumoniae]